MSQWGPFDNVHYFICENNVKWIIGQPGHEQRAKHKSRLSVHYDSPQKLHGIFSANWILHVHTRRESLDSIGGTVTMLRAVGSAVRIPEGKTFFSSPNLPDRLGGPTQPHIHGYWNSFLGVKCRGVELATQPHIVSKFNMSRANQPTNQRASWGRRLAQKCKSTSLGLFNHSCVNSIAELSNRHLKL
jgi:hypothetical protein